MKPFNLAEARIAERTYCQRQLNRRARIIVLLVTVVVFAATASYACKSMIASRAAQARSELAAAEERSAGIERGLADVKARLSQRKWQNQLAQTSGDWLSILDSALEHMPDDIWLARIESSPKDLTLSIEGHAATLDSLSQYMTDLRANRAFSDVRLGSARATRAANGVYIDFIVPIKIRQGASAAPDSQPTASAGRAPAVKGVL